jgi:hypothetical protein
LRCGLGHFKLSARFLKGGAESFDLLLLARISRYKPSDGRLLFLVFAVLFAQSTVGFQITIAAKAVKRKIAKERSVNSSNISRLPVRGPNGPGAAGIGDDVGVFFI